MEDKNWVFLEEIVESSWFEEEIFLIFFFSSDGETCKR